MNNAARDPNTVSVTIDGTAQSVPKGTLVIRAAERLGITIPRFCDHPLLEPIGACRQCMVEVEGQRKPFTACTTQCTDGMVVKTHLTSEVARQAQEGQLEFLLINHPLDCPQCDKGGECPLQDQALAHGPPDSRMLDRKRRYEKPIGISPLVLLDRERCVLCARCTRFSDQIAGDPFIELFERGALEQVAIYPDEPYESYFSGNIVQICPVGALTSSDYRFKSRPFDLRSHDGVCNQCSAGCNLRIDERRGLIQRQLARDNAAVNEAWNCDKGRFAFPSVHRPERFREPRVRDDNGDWQPTSWWLALGSAADGLRTALQRHGPGGVGVLTGGRVTDEDAYALSRFTREVLASDNVDFRTAPGAADEPGVLGAVAATEGPTYEAVEHADVVVVAGLDTEEEVPILHLRLRKAWRNRRQRIVVVGPVLGSLSELAWRWVRTPAGQEAPALRGLCPSGAAPTAGNEPAGLTAVADVLDTLSAGADAGEPADPPRVVVLAGERLAQSAGGLAAAAELAHTRGAGFAWVPRRSNARGNLDAGLLPGLLPGGRTLASPGAVADVWQALPERVGLDARGMLAAAARGELGALYLVGVDPVRDFDDPELARAALARVDTVVSQDLLPTDTTAFADVLLPARAAQERVGSFTNWEGRRQPFEQAVPVDGLAQRDWDITRQLAQRLGHDLGWESADDVRREAAPLMRPRPLALGSVSVDGDAPAASAPTDDDRFDVVVIDALLGQGTMLLGADVLAASAPTPTVRINESDARRLGISAGQHVAITGPGGRMELPARVTDGVVPGCVVLPRNSTPTVPGSLRESGSTGALRVSLAPLDVRSPLSRAQQREVAVVGAGEQRWPEAGRR